MVWSMSTELSVEGEVTLANTHRQIRLFFFTTANTTNDSILYTHTHIRVTMRRNDFRLIGNVHAFRLITQLWIPINALLLALDVLSIYS